MKSINIIFNSVRMTEITIRANKKCFLTFGIIDKFEVKREQSKNKKQDTETNCDKNNIADVFCSSSFQFTGGKQNL